MLKYMRKHIFSHIVLNTDIDGIFFLCKKAKKGSKETSKFFCMNIIINCFRLKEFKNI